MGKKMRIALSIVLFCIFAVMFIVGGNIGETSVVMAKAQAICMQCIGIG